MTVAARLVRLRRRLGVALAARYAAGAALVTAPLWAAGVVGAGARIGLAELGLAAGIGAIAGWRRRPTLAGAASLVDGALRLDDRVLTAWAVGDAPGPMGALLTADAARRWDAAAAAHGRRGAPGLRPRWPWASAAAVGGVVVAALVWRAAMPGGTTGVLALPGGGAPGAGRAAGATGAAGDEGAAGAASASPGAAGGAVARGSASPGPGGGRPAGDAAMSAKSQAPPGSSRVARSPGAGHDPAPQPTGGGPGEAPGAGDRPGRDGGPQLHLLAGGPGATAPGEDDAAPGPAAGATPGPGASGPSAQTGATAAGPLPALPARYRAVIVRYLASETMPDEEPLAE